LDEIKKVYIEYIQNGNNLEPNKKTIKIENLSNDLDDESEDSDVKSEESIESDDELDTENNIFDLDIQYQSAEINGKIIEF
jgi:hypothetical protein